jgi:hypothetical protein
VLCTDPDACDGDGQCGDGSRTLSVAVCLDQTNPNPVSVPSTALRKLFVSPKPTGGLPGSTPSGSRTRHGVVPARRSNIAAGEPPDREREANDRTAILHRETRVLRAGRMKPAPWSEPRRQASLVDVEESADQARDHARPHGLCGPWRRSRWTSWPPKCSRTSRCPRSTACRSSHPSRAPESRQ